MTGDGPFDPDYPTLPGFILGITERIWELRDIGLIRRTYGPDVAMHTGTGSVSGVDAVVAGTLATLHAFPDRRLLGEDVIWSGGAAGAGYSSHRIASTMHHRNDGAFGPATGCAVLVRTIADCLMRPGADREARIVEEWLVRDQSAIALQLGIDPRELGERWAATTPPAPAPGWDEVRDLSARPSIGPASGEPGAACAEAAHRIWNEADLSTIRRHYSPGVTLHLPAGRVAAGHDALDGFVVGLLASFPDARLRVDHVIARADTGHPVRIALRWRLAGTHSGFGAFGPPSGARVVIPGITHSEMTDGRVSREFILVDEIAVWTAIAARRG